MEFITKYNVSDLCHEKCCDKKYTMFERVELNGLVFLVAFCDAHAEIWEDNQYKQEKRLLAKRVKPVMVKKANTFHSPSLLALSPRHGVVMQHSCPMEAASKGGIK